MRQSGPAGPDLPQGYNAGLSSPFTDAMTTTDALPAAAIDSATAHLRDVLAIALEHTPERREIGRASCRERV